MCVDREEIVFRFVAFSLGRWFCERRISKREMTGEERLNRFHRIEEQCLCPSLVRLWDSFPFPGFVFLCFFFVLSARRAEFLGRDSRAGSDRDAWVSFPSASNRVELLHLDRSSFTRNDFEDRINLSELPNAG